MAILQVGTHDVKVGWSALSESSAGNLQIEIGFEDPIDAEENITAYLSMSDKAWPYTKAKLKELGWNQDEKDPGEIWKLNEDPSPIAGAEVEIEVISETYQGKDRLKVNRIGNAGGFGGGPRERMDQATAKKKVAEWRKRMITAGGPSANMARKQATAGKKPVNNSDDDVPY